MRMMMQAAQQVTEDNSLETGDEQYAFGEDDGGVAPDLEEA